MCKTLWKLCINVLISPLSTSCDKIMPQNSLHFFDKIRVKFSLLYHKPQRCTSAEIHALWAEKRAPREESGKKGEIFLKILSQNLPLGVYRVEHSFSALLRGWKHGMMAVEHGERRRAAPMNEKTMAFEELLTAAAGERFRRRLAALGEEESLRREYGSFSSLDRRIRRALGGRGKERTAAARRRKGRRRVLRRVLITAAVLAALLLGMFTSRPRCGRM